jgi:hypothetical protein
LIYIFNYDNLNQILFIQKNKEDGQMEPEKIKELHDLLDRVWKPWVEKGRKLGEFNWHNSIITVWGTGWCFWTKIWFEKDGKKFYELVRSELKGLSGDDLRNEFFGAKLVRTYDGDQKCFIEFCEILSQPDHFPEKEEFDEVGRLFKLESSVQKLYYDFYIKIFR